MTEYYEGPCAIRILIRETCGEKAVEVWDTKPDLRVSLLAHLIDDHLAGEYPDSIVSLILLAGSYTIATEQQQPPTKLHA